MLNLSRHVLRLELGLISFSFSARCEIMRGSVDVDAGTLSPEPMRAYRKMAGLHGVRGRFTGVSVHRAHVTDVVDMPSSPGSDCLPVIFEE